MTGQADQNHDLPAAGLDVATHEEDLICVAHIARPQGIRGEVIAVLLTDFPERFAKLDVAQVKIANGETRRLLLQKFWLHKGRIVLKFAGFDTMNAAEELRDARVMVTREQLVPLPKDTFYDFDLAGCEVVTASGQHIGQVANVENYGAAPLLVVNDGIREHLIPLASSICIDVDVPRKRIVIDPPEGLLDL